MKEIRLTQDKVMLVDDDDFDFMNEVKWSAMQKGNKWYAVSRQGGSGPQVYAHCQLIGGNGQQIDHKDGNGLNNQRTNLRFATHAQNQANRGLGVKNTTGYKGVIIKAGNKRPHAAGIKVNGKNVYLGAYYTIEEAARAYDKKAREIHGEFAKVNFS